MGVLAWVVAMGAAPFVVFCGYLFALTLLSGRRKAPAFIAAPRERFDVVVPAHNEEAGIARTVKNLLALDYPRELFRVRVIADNCGDATAERARAVGAGVLERFDSERRGKGYALSFAFERSLREGFADAVVVVDADTVVSTNLLHAFAARLRTGALAIQAEYGVQNPEQSWRTELMRIAFALFHQVRSLGREKLGLSCGLRGNGMCFARRLLEEQPHRAFSIVEDVEYGVQIGRAGHRVHFAQEAQVLGEMVAGERASRSQRQRWEDGRRALVKQLVPSLAKDAVRRRSALLADLAMDLVVPPLAQLGLGVALGALAAGWLALAGQPWALLPWAVCVGFLAAYVVRGWQLSGSGWRGASALARAPFYLAWKVGLRLRGERRGQQWVRTVREGEVAR